MIQIQEPTLTARWARLGIAFDDEPALFTPDVERLLLDTARAASSHPRLVTMPVSWLTQYAMCVARLRLAALAEHELEFRFAPVLGFLLEAAHAHLGDEPFADAIDVCRAKMEQIDLDPQPLFGKQRRTAALCAIAERESSDVARLWRLWAKPVELRLDVIHPPRRVIARNPELQRRADLQGDLRCSILEVLRHDPEAGASAVELQRHCHLRSYPPILNAIKELERAGSIERIPDGVSKRIRLIDPRAAA